MKFIQVIDADNGSKMLISINRIKSVFESDKDLFIEYNDGETSERILGSIEEVATLLA